MFSGMNIVDGQMHTSTINSAVLAHTSLYARNSIENALSQDQDHFNVLKGSLLPAALIVFFPAQQAYESQ
jgi:hypothetical protein